MKSWFCLKHRKLRRASYILTTAPLPQQIQVMELRVLSPQETRGSEQSDKPLSQEGQAPPRRDGWSSGYLEQVLLAAGVALKMNVECPESAGPRQSVYLKALPTPYIYTVVATPPEEWVPVLQPLRERQ